MKTKKTERGRYGETKSKQGAILEGGLGAARGREKGPNHRPKRQKEQPDVSQLPGKGG